MSVQGFGIYKQIKQQVTARQVAEHYGYRVNRAGMMRCPFHKDRNPSMRIDQNFICFGCQEKGDVIDFAAKLFNLSKYEAAQKLIADFQLSITTETAGASEPKRGLPVAKKINRDSFDAFELRIQRRIAELEFTKGDAARREIEALREAERVGGKLAHSEPDEWSSELLQRYRTLILKHPQLIEEIEGAIR